MPTWNKVLQEITEKEKAGHQSVDLVRRAYLLKLNRHTKRNIIAYYSGWLTKPPQTPNMTIGDDDLNGFMSVVHALDRSRGLDLLLHTPGGDIAATEALVSYLWKMFDRDLRVIVPQLAMSAGTMVACAARTIVMGKQSSLGPIDPQLNGLPAQGVLEEFQVAIKQVEHEPASLPIWQAIIGKYHPTFLWECQQAIQWASQMVENWLANNMFAGRQTSVNDAKKVVEFLSNHDITKSHSRHISFDKCLEIGLNIELLENDNKFQDLVLTVHHAYMLTIAKTQTIKIIENHKGIALVTLSG
ncbi:hypothetical protein SIID45300_02062 [Candidatus Magnetaquicoccaceae bacterium FCR-1]|uniref:Serine protease n=1 Tax=Candidatus Magnetaquiglobus chichijimensis TaxID=3141448 RepID=A0ABQ0CA28_9PROT